MKGSKMLLELVILGVIFASLVLWLGNSQQSFPLAYFAMFSFWVVGIMMMNSGVDIQTGNNIVTSGLTTTVTDTYTNYSMSNNWVVNLVASFLFYFPIIGTLLTVWYAKR